MLNIMRICININRLWLVLGNGYELKSNILAVF